MARLTKAEIIAKADIPFEDVEIEEWGGTVRVRGLSALARQKYHSELIKRIRPDGSPEMDMEKASMVRFLTKVLVNEDNTPLFTEQEVDLLGEKSPVVLERLQKVGLRLSGMDTGEKKEEGKN